MNRKLADAMATVNTTLLFLLPIGSALGCAVIFGLGAPGVDEVNTVGVWLLGAFVGLAGGALQAFLICGALAILISSYETLKEIRDRMGGRAAPAPFGIMANPWPTPEDPADQAPPRTPPPPAQTDG